MHAPTPNLFRIGMSPGQYMRLRRLNLMHTALPKRILRLQTSRKLPRGMDSPSLGVSPDFIGRFSREMPSETLRSSLITGT
jgi:hypothetical protein